MADLARSADDLALVLDADIEAQSRSAGPDQVLRVVARRLGELCSAPMVDIYAVDGDDLRALVGWSYGRFTPDAGERTVPLAERPLTRAVVASGRTETIALARRSPAQRRRAARPWTQRNAQSFSEHPAAQQRSGHRRRRGARQPAARLRRGAPAGAGARPRSPRTCSTRRCCSRPWSSATSHCARSSSSGRASTRRAGPRTWRPSSRSACSTSWTPPAARCTAPSAAACAVSSASTGARAATTRADADRRTSMREGGPVVRDHDILVLSDTGRPAPHRERARGLGAAPAS